MMLLTVAYCKWLIGIGHDADSATTPKIVKRQPICTGKYGTVRKIIESCIDL